MKGRSKETATDRVARFFEERGREVFTWRSDITSALGITEAEASAALVELEVSGKIIGHTFATKPRGYRLA